MSRQVLHGLAIAGVVAAGFLVAPPAEARGFVSFGIGVPLYAPAPYYYPPPPAYYPPPPPVYYYPPPAVQYAPPPAQYAAPAAPQQQQDCREYQTTTTIDGRPQQTVGTACLQSDGTWRIVR